MMSVLKPNKANVVGTVLLLAANWVAGFVPRLVMPLLSSGSQAAASAGRGAFTAGSAGMRAGGYAGGAAYGLVGSAAGLLMTALLFYVILSFVIAKLAGEAKTEAEKKPV